MKATLISDQITPLDAKTVALAFRSAYEKVCGKTPPNACLALLVAQSALETGRWKSIHCFNFGNVKASPDYYGYYCQFRCNEVIKGKVEWFDPPHPQCNFRAFDSVEVGALDHIRFLAQRKRYAKAWEVAQTGMPLAFVEALKAAGYFTADAGPYARAVTSLWKEYLGMVERLKETDTEPAPPPDSEPGLRELALAAVAKFDPLEAARLERIEQLKEPADGT
jgi:hypothetical protein